MFFKKVFILSNALKVYFYHKIFFVIVLLSAMVPKLNRLFVFLLLNAIETFAFKSMQPQLDTSKKLFLVEKSRFYEQGKLNSAAYIKAVALSPG